MMKNLPDACDLAKELSSFMYSMRISLEELLESCKKLEKNISEGRDLLRILDERNHKDVRCALTYKAEDYSADDAKELHEKVHFEIYEDALRRRLQDFIGKSEGSCDLVKKELKTLKIELSQIVNSYGEANNMMKEDIQIDVFDSQPFINISDFLQNIKTFVSNYNSAYKQILQEQQEEEERKKRKRHSQVKAQARAVGISTVGNSPKLQYKKDGYGFPMHEEPHAQIEAKDEEMCRRLSIAIICKEILDNIVTEAIDSLVM